MSLSGLGQSMKRAEPRTFSSLTLRSTGFLSQDGRLVRARSKSNGVLGFEGLLGFRDFGYGHHIHGQAYRLGAACSWLEAKSNLGSSDSYFPVETNGASTGAFLKWHRGRSSKEITLSIL